jgi:hypothetical protein
VRARVATGREPQLLRGPAADDADERPPSPAARAGVADAARWEETWPGNTSGVASALTTCSSMRWWGILRLKPFFWVRRNCPPIRKWDAKPLVALSFIHFAQWSLVDRLPGNGGMPEQRLRPRYLLFLTNFNGGFDQYIDAFSHVIGLRIRLIWSGSHGFPGPEPATTFKEYIHRQEFAAAHFYSAYPEATAFEVQRALAAADDHAAFERDASNDPFEFAQAWAALLTKIERSL